MSDKELNRFLADIESDASLNQAVQALRPAGDADNRVGAEALIAFAQQRGYQLDMDDFMPEVGELDENELAAVVGGATAQGSNAMVKLNPAFNSNHGKWIDILSFKFF
ncbi:MAG: Nif11-like leader peptide family natural product precursor [Gammaproteobacteria bacterium]